MRRSTAASRSALSLSLALAAVLTPLGCAPAPGGGPLDEPHGDHLPTPALQSLSNFLENRGQWHDEVLFYARSAGIDATLTADALVLRPVQGPEAEPVEPLVLRLPAANGRERPVEGEGEVATRHHFFHGGRSASNARAFESVFYRDVAPGIDVRVVTREGRFAYDLLVSPHASVEDLVLEVEGADRLELLAPDALAIHTPGDVVEQRIGKCWQVDPETGIEESVASRFRVLSTEGSRLRFGFECPDRDPLAAFVLDPSFLFSTYVGGSTQETLSDHKGDVEVGPDGSVYLACTTWCCTPTTPGSFQPSDHPGVDAWVGKLSPDGTTLEWGAFLGGEKTTTVAAIEVAPDGSVLVAGGTWSEDFPTTPGALQTTFAGKSDAFVTKISSDGSTLLWSTFFGGSDNDSPKAATLLSSGDLVFAATSLSLDIQTTPGAFDPFYDEGDLLLVRFAADGSSVVFATYFKTGRILDMASDAESNIYLAGDAGLTSIPIPTTPGAFQEDFGGGIGNKAYVAKVDPLGTEVIWCTYFGGDLGSESAWGIAVDAASAVYITGQVNSPDMPVTPGTFSHTPTGTEGFVAKLLPGGSDLVWSTFLGSCCGGAGHLWDVQVDAAGNAHVVGAANEGSYPVTPDALQPSPAGPILTGDAYITKLDAFAEDLVYSSWFGGTSSEMFPQVALRPDGNPVIAVMSWSADAPITPGAFQSQHGGSADLLVAGFDLGLLPWRILGGGLAGAAETPYLAGSGALVPGAATRLSLRGGVPAAPAWIVAGTGEAGLPLLGGTLVPSPEILHPLLLGPTGGFDFVFPWPPLPPGTELTFQLWSLDLGAPQGWSASNAIRAIAQ